MVFHTKYKENGTIERLKAHLVAQGYTQKQGLDFKETFSPVVRKITIQVVLSTTVTLNWPMRQLDMKNAFLQGFLKETIYIK